MRRNFAKIVASRRGIAIKETQMSHLSPDDLATGDSWRVVRQDDNGNRFVVRTELTRADAERIAEEFGGRKHKQHYWAEREST